MPRSVQRVKKRKYKDINRFDQAKKEKKTESENDTSTSSSAKKIGQNIPSECENKDDFNLIMNFSTLKDIIDTLVCCRSCSKPVGLYRKNKLGLKYLLEIRCTSCDWKETFSNSKNVSNKNKSGFNIAAINLQSVMAFREIGCGFAAMQTFSRVMNMESPMSVTTYNKMNQSLYSAYSVVALKSTTDAAVETRKTILHDTFNDDVIADCQVSIDGTWQRRGQASLNGVVVAVSKENGKVVDTAIMSKRCKGCQIWSKMKKDARYNDWKQNHHCQANHFKSSGAMEGAGAVTIFNRSINKNKLRYVSYIGDGDTSSYAEVVASNPYGNIEVEKLECIGHVNKRMGTRCRKLLQTYKGKKLSDGKGLSGKGRLTNKAMNVLQNYYGMSIRQNINNLYAMKKGVWAVLFHNADISDSETRHQFCPRTVDSWCLYQSNKLTGKDTYKKKLSLPIAIKNILMPIFRDLSDGKLLSKCLHGQTQNANEAFNGLIWKRCPKTTYVSKYVLEIAVNSAVINFNGGFVGLAAVFNELGIELGCQTQRGFVQYDNNRVKRMNAKSTSKVKSARKRMRHVKKGFLDKEKEEEPVPCYSKGAY